MASAVNTFELYLPKSPFLVASIDVRTVDTFFFTDDCVYEDVTFGVIMPAKKSRRPRGQQPLSTRVRFG